MYAAIAAAKSVLPFLRATIIKTSLNCLYPVVLSIMPNMADTIAFCHNSRCKRSLRPSEWWQKFSMNFIALFAFFSLNSHSPFNSPVVKISKHNRTHTPTITSFFWIASWYLKIQLSINYSSRNAAKRSTFSFSFGGKYSMSEWIIAVYWREYFS